MIPSPGTPLPLNSPKDPDGLDPSGFEMLSGEEPMDILPSERSLNAMNEQDALPPTPTHKNFHPPGPVLALLVGEPPPPPPTPPPRKRRSSSGRNSSGRNSSERRKKLGEVGTPEQRSSFSGRSPNSDPLVKTFEQRSLDSPSEEENRNIAERLEAARDAIHKSDLKERSNIAQDSMHGHESMDPPTVERRVGPTHSLPTPTEKALEQESSWAIWPDMNPPSINDDNITLPSNHSPASNCTEQHANHLQGAPLSKKGADVMAASQNVFSSSSASKSVSPKTTNESGKPQKKFRSKTSERLRRAHRALTPERKRLWQMDGVADVVTKDLGSPASAGRSTSTKTTHVSGIGKKFRPKTPERLRRALTPDRKRSKTPDKKRSKNPLKKGTKTLDKKSPKGSEKQRVMPQVREAADKEPSVDLQQNHVANNILASNKQTNKRGFLRGLFRNNKKKKQDTAEPDITTVSSGALVTAKSGSVKSVLVEENVQDKQVGDEKHINKNKNGDRQNFGSLAESGEDDCPHVLLGDDEVSTLTNPTYDMLRQDPSVHQQAMSDPVGHYFNRKLNVPVEAKEPTSSRLPATDPGTESILDEPEETIKFSTSSFSGKSNFVVRNGNNSFDPFGESPHDLGAGVSGPDFPRSTVRDPTPRGNDATLFNAHQLRDPSPRIQNPSPGLQDPSPRGCSTPQFPKPFQADPFGESPLYMHQRGPSVMHDGTPYVADPPLVVRTFQHPPNLLSCGEMFEDAVLGDSKGKAKPVNHSIESVKMEHSNHEVKKEDDIVGSFLSPKRPPTPSQKKRALRLRHLSVSPKYREASSEPSTPTQNRKQVNGIQDEAVSSDHEKVERESTSPATAFVKGTFSSEALSLRMSRRTMSPRATSEAVTDKTPIHVNLKETAAANEPIDSDLVLQASSSQFCSHNEHALGETELSVASEAETFDSSVSGYSKYRNKHLTMSSAARINAKAVAYLHTLNGDPSPRRAWRKPEVSDEESSPRRGIRDPLDPFFSSKAKTSVRKNPTSGGEGNRLKGRKPMKKDASPRAETTQSVLMIESRNRSNLSQRVSKSEESNTGVSFQRPATAFSFGVDFLRKKRERDIESGITKRVVPKKVVKPPKVRSYFDSDLAREPRDPIQRAGRRLLAKAAIPIQTQIRRFLAQREAVDRMWATIEIQSYVRRWRAEASLLAYRECAITIQKVFRRCRVVMALERRQIAAVEIQRIVRGFIASVHTFDTVYRIILIQAKFRGNLARKEVSAMKDKAATCIQTWWRSRSARVHYQFFIVDLIIVQSAIRRWRARQEYKSHLFAVQNQAAIRIQAAWRCFQGYTDYIFSVVDILLVQRTARQWLARKKLKFLRRELAALKIQSSFRKYRCQMLLLRKLVKIIIVQSIARSFLAQKSKEKAINCATKIQTAWRGFWSFSHYVILVYHISRVQALARGMLVRRNQNLQLGCSIMIQSAARRFLAKKEVENVKVSKTLVMAAAKAMREKLASSRIQFWWRVVLECRKERQAALVIERFFLFVKHEVEKEINRSLRKKNSKGKRSRRVSKEIDEKWLERVWLNTVDETDVESFVHSPSESIASSRLHGSSKHDRKALSHRASSPTLNHIMRHELASKKSPDGLNLTYSVDGTDLSPTSPSLPVSPRRMTTMTDEELQDDLSLEEAFLDAAVEQGKKRRNTAEKYMKKFGLRSYEKTSFSPAHHFFADDLESTCSTSVQGVMYSLNKTPSNSHSPQQKRKAPQSTKSYSSHHARQLLQKMGHSMEKPPKSPRKEESPRHGNILVMEYPEYSSKGKAQKTKKRDEEEYDGEVFGLI